MIETDGPNRALRGPNWTQLVLGSEGTMGVITSARLRVSPAPQLRVYRGFEVEDVAAGTAAIRRVVQKGLRPAVVRLYDELDTLINSFGHSEGPQHDLRAPAPALATGALPGWPEPAPDEHGGVLERLIDLARGRGLRGGAIKAALGQSELVNKLVGTVAERIARRGCRMIIGLEGARIRTEVEARADVRRARGGRLPRPGRGVRAGRGSRTATRVSYRMSPVFRDGAFVDTMEVASSWERLLDLYHSVRAAIGRHAVVMAHFSHAYADGCSIYFTFAGHAPERGASERRVRRDLARRPRGRDARRRDDQPPPRRRAAQGTVHGGRAPRGDGDLRGSEARVRSRRRVQPGQDGPAGESDASARCRRAAAHARRRARRASSATAVSRRPRLARRRSRR